jgi:hypothetical protein
MADRKKPGIAFWATVVVVAVLVPSAIYLGAYAWLIEPTPAVAHVTTGEEYHFIMPRYPRLGDSPFWSTFFEPANRLDRRVRPEAWISK